MLQDAWNILSGKDMCPSELASKRHGSVGSPCITRHTDFIPIGIYTESDERGNGTSKDTPVVGIEFMQFRFGGVVVIRLVKSCDGWLLLFLVGSLGVNFEALFAFQ